MSPTSPIDKNRGKAPTNDDARELMFLSLASKLNKQVSYFDAEETILETQNGKNI